MWVKTLEEFKKINLEKVIAVDTETTDLNPRKAELEGIGWGDSQGQYYVDWATCDFREEVIKEFKKLFKEKEIIFHNAKFDIKIFKEILNINFPLFLHDTMIMSWLLNENRSHGLKELTSSILKRKAVTYEEVPKEVTLFEDVEKLKKAMAKYCCGDVKNTYDLFQKFMPLLKEEKLDYCYNNIEIPLVKVLTKMELKGVVIDIGKLKTLAKKAKAVLLEKESLIYSLVGEQKFNIRSSKQLRELIFDKLRVKPLKVTPAGVPSTDHESLKALAKTNKEVDAILDFREFDKLNGTYLEGLQEKAENGILYTDFLQHRTRSGRLASANPNLQNIPVRSDEFDVRQAFVPRDGYKFIIADYSQIELRVVAYFSQEPSMIETFKNNGDIHQLTASMVGCSRSHAKNINFGMIYGLGPKNLAKDLGISVEQGKRYMDTFFGKYSRLNSYISEVQTIGYFRGYALTLANRKRRFKIVKNMTKGETEAIKRRLINTTIQGSAADLMKIAMVRIDRRLKKYDADMLIQIHDEVVVECKKDQIEEVSKEIKEGMEEAVTFNIPIPVDLKVAGCWIK